MPNFIGNVANVEKRYKKMDINKWFLGLSMLVLYLGFTFYHKYDNLKVLLENPKDTLCFSLFFIIGFTIFFYALANLMVNYKKQQQKTYLEIKKLEKELKKK